MGRKFEFCPHPFSFPPSHLFNFLALLLSSSSGESLSARVVENQYSFRVCACVCMCVYVREGERERDCVYVCRRDEREAPCSCVLQLSHRITVQSCPATAPAQTRALRYDWLIFTSIHHDQARTRLFQYYPPSSPPLSISPYLPLPITHLFPC